MMGLADEGLPKQEGGGFGELDFDLAYKGLEGIRDSVTSRSLPNADGATAVFDSTNYQWQVVKIKEILSDAKFKKSLSDLLDEVLASGPELLASEEIELWFADTEQVQKLYALAYHLLEHTKSAVENGQKHIKKFIELADYFTRKRFKRFEQVGTFQVAPMLDKHSLPVEGSVAQIFVTEDGKYVMRRARSDDASEVILHESELYGRVSSVKDPILDAHLPTMYFSGAEANGRQYIVVDRITNPVALLEDTGLGKLADRKRICIELAEYVNRFHTNLGCALNDLGSEFSKSNNRDSTLGKFDRFLIGEVIGARDWFDSDLNGSVDIRNVSELRGVLDAIGGEVQQMREEIALLEQYLRVITENNWDCFQMPVLSEAKIETRVRVRARAKMGSLRRLFMDMGIWGLSKKKIDEARKEYKAGEEYVTNEMRKRGREQIFNKIKQTFKGESEGKAMGILDKYQEKFRGDVGQLMRTIVENVSTVHEALDLHGLDSLQIPVLDKVVRQNELDGLVDDKLGKINPQVVNLGFSGYELPVSKSGELPHHKLDMVFERINELRSKGVWSIRQKHGVSSGELVYYDYRQIAVGVAWILTQHNPEYTASLYESIKRDLDLVPKAGNYSDECKRVLQLAINNYGKNVVNQ